MLTPGRRARRSVLTPSRVSGHSRTASPFTLVPEKPQIVSETSQYQLISLPHSFHPVARDIVKRNRASGSGVHGKVGFVVEGCKAVLWNVGDGMVMYELLAPSDIMSVTLLQNNTAIIITSGGEVIYLSNITQPQRYYSNPILLPNKIISITRGHDGMSVLVLDKFYKVWRCTSNLVEQLNPESTFGGISKRVSSMFWTSPEAMLGSPLKAVDTEDDAVFVVGVEGLQLISNSMVLWTVTLKSLLPTVDSPVILDATLHDKHLIFLVRSANGVTYLATLSTRHHNTTPDKPDTIVSIPDSQLSRICIKDGMFGIIHNGNSNVNILGIGKEFAIVPLDIASSIDISSIGFYLNEPCLLTRQLGVVRVVVKDVKAALTNMSVDPETSTSGLVEARFEEAFKCFLNFNETVEQSKLQDILETSDIAHINRIISQTAEYLISSSPASDPRWGYGDAKLPVTLGFQIEERIRRLKALLQFLVSTGYYQNLVADKENDNISSRILQYLEKCIAAKVICDSGSDLVNQALDRTANILCSDTNNNILSSADVVFSKIDRIDVFFKMLSLVQKHALTNKSDELLQDVYTSVEVVQQCFTHILSCRDESKQLYTIALDRCEERTWVDTEEIRSFLEEQYSVAMERILPEIDEDSRYQVLIVAASLTDSLLKLYTNLMIRLPSNDNELADLRSDYERRRSVLIEPFVTHKVYKIAFSLAEEFQHFTLLVQLCEECDDNNKLRSLSLQYPGFADVAYKWYMDQGKESKLLTANIMDRKKLSDFLNANEKLQWIYQLGQKNYVEAGSILTMLGAKEEEMLSRKKSLLSIGKLALLADDNVTVNTAEIHDINRVLDVITHQERLKPEILDNAGLHPDTMIPMSASQLIRLSISEKNPTFEDIDVKKALDLLQNIAQDEDISDDDFDKLRLEIWISVIKRDKWWKKCRHYTPEQIDETLFYRSVILAYNSGLPISHFLPTVLDIISKGEWKSIFEDDDHVRQFEYILKSGYEQMRDIGIVCH